jgi:acyl carrier protein
MEKTFSENTFSENTMERNEVQTRVVNVVCQVLGVESEQVKPESHFVYDLGAESTQSVELVAAFEHEFRIEMDEDAALEVQTIGDAVDFIAQCL